MPENDLSGPGVTTCWSHPDTLATSYCTSCGRPLCADCTRQAMGAILCQTCLDARQALGGPAPTPGAAPTTGVRVLRPLNFVDLFDEAFSLYRNHFVLLVGVLAIVQFPATFLFSLAQAPFQGFEPPGQRFPRAAAPPAVPDAGQFVLLFVAIILLVFASIFGQGALTKAIADVYLNRPTSIKGCYRFLFVRFLPYVATSIVAGLVSMVGMMLCCVGFFWGFFATQCFVVEGTGVFHSVERSMFLARGNWWRCFAIVLVTTIVVQFAVGIFVTPLTVAIMFGGSSPALQAASALAQAVATSLLAPLQLIVFSLLYFDLRVRKEGFDLQLLASSLSTPSDK